MIGIEESLRSISERVKTHSSSMATEEALKTAVVLPALRATGKSVKYTDSIVEVTIVVKGRDAWRTLVFARGNSPAQSAEKDNFVRAVFGTVN